MTKTARVYGGSLYDLAAEEKLDGQIMEQMIAVRQIFRENPGYLKLLGEPAIPEDERLKMIEEAFGGQAERYLVNFLKLLCERKILREFAGCCEEFIRRYNSAHGIAEAVVTSAVKLSDTQMEALKAKLEKLSGKKVYLVQKTGILIGAGAGASTAAGISMGGKRFTDNFAEFIEKYGSRYMTDMYAAGFYPFPTEEAKWGYWSKAALLNRFDLPALPLYKELYDIVKRKEYFVLTTNVDHQFYKAGFDENRIFATQGDYGKIQCQKACHPKTYDAQEVFRKMDEARKECLIPSELVPKCPVCGGRMEMNLRCDNYFVEDEAWHEAADRYADFLKQNRNKKVVLLELGVGFNTPIIIRFPFEKMVRENSSYSLIRLNMDEAVVPESFGKRAIGIEGDMERAITDIRGQVL